VPSDNVPNDAVTNEFPITRRRLFAYTSALAGLSAIPNLVSCATTPRAAPSAGRDPFTLGLASGDPSSDGMVLWTRLAPDPLAQNGLGGMANEAVAVQWEIAADDQMRSVVARGDTLALPDDAHAVHVEVAGLQPNRPYWYRFRALGAESAIGRTRTAPAATEAVDRLRLSFASCSNWELGYFSAYRHMAAEDPDLVLFLGDYIYEYSYKPGERAKKGVVRTHAQQDEIADLAAYRNRYAQYRTDEDLQRLHATAPCLMTWDDHEVQNDYGGPYSEWKDTDPAKFLQRRAAAYKAYWENMPLRKPKRPSGADMRIYDRVRWGDLAQFTILDGRQYRTHIQPCPDANSKKRGGHAVTDACAERLDDQRSMLGFEQEKWLFDGFKQGDRARWNLFAQDLLVAEVHAPQKGNAGFAHWTDAWDGWPATRARMLQAIEQTRLSNPVFFGGDYHSFWATDLKRNNDDAKAPVLATEFVGTSVTHTSTPPYDYQDIAPRNPHIKFYDRSKRGYVSVDVTRNQVETRFQALDDARDAKTGVSTLAKFHVENGRAGAIKV
jgi:alkaline phosphatase D